LAVGCALTLGNDAVDATWGSLERDLAGIAFWEPVARKVDFDACSGHVIESALIRRTSR
jgi:hypothetical protein